MPPNQTLDGGEKKIAIPKSTVGRTQIKPRNANITYKTQDFISPRSLTYAQYYKLDTGQ